jgi:hypothetical protein
VARPRPGLPRRADPLRRDRYRRSLPSADFQLPAVSVSRHEGARIATNRGKSARRAVVAQGSKRQAIAGRPLIRGNPAGHPCEGMRHRWAVASQARAHRVRRVRKVCSRVYSIAEVDGQHAARRAPVNNRHGSAGLASGRKPVRKNVSDAGLRARARTHQWRPSACRMLSHSEMSNSSRRASHRGHSVLQNPR